MAMLLLPAEAWPSGSSFGDCPLLAISSAACTHSSCHLIAVKVLEHAPHAHHHQTVWEISALSACLITYGKTKQLAV